MAPQRTNPPMKLPASNVLVEADFVVVVVEAVVGSAPVEASGVVVGDVTVPAVGLLSGTIDAFVVGITVEPFLLSVSIPVVDVDVCTVVTGVPGVEV